MLNRMMIGSLAIAGLTGLAAVSGSIMTEHHATASVSPKSPTLTQVPIQSVIEGEPEVQVAGDKPRMKQFSLLTPIVQVESAKSTSVVKETRKVRPTNHHPSVAAHRVAYHPVVYHRVVHRPVQRPAPSGTASAKSAVANTNLYWLSHIIHAEAAGQPMNAQIAVGDVVLNRVHSGQYASTVKGVIFQVLNGHYQFTPVLNGWIYSQPDAASIQAAQKALQGVNLVPNALVYYTPSKTPTNSWVRQQPTITSIGDFIFAK